MTKIEGKYYQSFCELAEAMASVRSPKDVLDCIVERVAKATGAKGCSLMLVQPDNKTLVYVAVYGLSEGYLQKGAVSAEKSVGEALAGKAVTFLNAPEDERIQYREEARREGIVSILSVPMMFKGDAIGVLVVYMGKPHYFIKADIYFVTAAARLAAITLQKAKELRMFGFT